ncbi:hypothetical protein LX69_01528 [Breznakibacter xylanolyticus]|uniref:Uncharacterized protein n=1 Tax=Breznakibacter xylanolyticus TaxID=990 RepID=A0A2W7NC75_9BACT|nr:hypothetical protein LX69_01528 [Breznakibacter xylanolyticus]
MSKNVNEMSKNVNEKCALHLVLSCSRTERNQISLNIKKKKS